jgi:hypothetical protein
MVHLLCYSDDACFDVAGIAFDAMPTSHQQPLQQQQDGICLVSDMGAVERGLIQTSSELNSPAVGCVHRLAPKCCRSA